ncbi:hypothetical protein DM01DRAFT_1080760 [Hesseltinella vesiculosa]|uniref:Uncharacterized protein n=1 Tax=Hesseltinella vesiculosa TaxID=101127 RepID=A0A1X2GDW0_9FUNG|nr:hypothetical protein DM01DRAFT_1080760 [Hesseltinella vesiculosa]
MYIDGQSLAMDDQEKPASVTPTRGSLSQLASKTVTGSSLDRLRNKGLATASANGKPLSSLASLQKPTVKPASSSLASLASKPTSSSLASLASTTTTKPVASSFSLASKSTAKPTSSLAALASASKPSSLTNTVPSSSLQSLAQKSQGQGKLTSLQNLASKRTSSPSPVSTLTNLATSPTSSLASLASMSSQKKSTGLASLAHRSTPSAPATPTSPALPSLTSLVTPKPAAVPSSPVVAGNLPTHQEPAKTIKYTTISPAPPARLIAPPSTAATFLFQPRHPLASAASDTIAATFSQSIAQSFYCALATKPSNIRVFQFDVPSPDDVALKAQSQRSGAKPTRSN